jgi:DNA-binding MarR family transcriptional regulator/GNAT superfamily N-acetyltransferase
MTSSAAGIASFRAFNRMYTNFLGTLQEGLLNTEFTLAEARILYELATREKAKAKEIAEALGMDSGYLSRILGKFERAALLKRKTAEEDGRASGITLTRRGAAAFKKLNQLSDEQARTVLQPLTVNDRERLICSMREIEEILCSTGSSQPLYLLRPHRAGDMGWVASREGAVYAEEYGWDGTFEALVARIVSDFVTNFDPTRERCWIAEAKGQSIGHIFLVKHPEEPVTAKLRLLFVEPSARGLGLGQALVSECLRFARTAGYKKVVLWTQSMLVAACRIYKNAGFQLIEEKPHHSFGRDLIGQTWELELR